MRWQNLALKDAHGGALDAFVASVAEGVNSVPNGELDAVEASIASFEARFKVRSADLKGKIYSGEIEDSVAIEAWLRLIRTRNALRELPVG